MKTLLASIIFTIVIFTTVNGEVSNENYDSNKSEACQTEKLSGSISGNILYYDKLDSKKIEPYIGISINLYDSIKTHPPLNNTWISEENSSHYIFKHLPFGEYYVNYSFVGCDHIWKRVKITKEKPHIHLGIDTLIQIEPPMEWATKKEVRKWRKKQ